jgi:hypothetical protein
METMIAASQTAAFAKSGRQPEDAYYCQQRPRTLRIMPAMDVVLTVALVALVAVGLLTA